MPQRPLSKADAKHFAAMLADWRASVQPRIDALTVPGASAAINADIDRLAEQIESRDAAWAIRAVANNIRSRLEYCEQGLYIRVDGEKWIYA